MKFIEALRYTQPDCLAFVGAGGKTTALFHAAREMIARSSPMKDQDKQTALATTTTHLGAWQASFADYWYPIHQLRELQALERNIPKGIVLVTGEEKDGLLEGLKGVMLDELQKIAVERQLPLLVEADGAHERPLKAPEEHEPAIPEFAQHVVVVAGMSGLGKPLTKEWVHRHEQYAKLSEMIIGQQITEEAVISVLMHKKGGLKNIPCGTRRSVLLNQADTPALQSQAQQIANRLIERYDACLIASLGKPQEELPGADKEVGEKVTQIYSVTEKMAGIILAAGEAQRFGKPKQLLQWKGQPVIRHAAMAALQAGLSLVVVVLGSSAELIQPAVQDLPLIIVVNERWKDGISSSIRTGLQSLPGRVGGALFLQADQPQVPPLLIRKLVEAHQTSLKPIIASRVNGQRSNPVLFDAITFSQLVTLKGDTGGRALFERFPIEWIDWQDEGLLIDIDTPEDFDRLSRFYNQDQVQA
jgi:molybdenum cofactor cytidylyltransferase